MTDPQTTVAQLKELVLHFSRERDWEKFHHPKDLGLALACEVGEVLEHFRYRTNAEVRAHLEGDDARRELAHELAALKYPVDRAFGRPDKYTAYQAPESEAP